MTKTINITALILGTAAGIAIAGFLRMSGEEKEELCNHLKDRTSQLLDNVEDTVEKVEHYMDEFKSTGEGEWIDKLYVLKKMFKKLYGYEKHYLL